MKTIYTAIIARLKAQVPALKWIDLDRGQLDARSDRPQVAFPAALIGIAIKATGNITDTIQECEATITVRLAFDNPAGRTSAQAPDDKRLLSLELYEVIADVYAALQGYGTTNFDSLTRTLQAKENSPNGYFQYRIEFKTVFEDNTA
jgi:hypothetical protein